MSRIKKIRLNYGAARFLLFLVFAAFFACAILCIQYAWLQYYLDNGEMISLFKQIVAVYGVHFAVILAGIFAVRKPDEESAPGYLFWVAFVLVLLWNINCVSPLVVLVWRLGPSKMDTAWFLEYFKTVPDLSSFLCTAALTFFFVKREQQAAEARGEEKGLLAARSGTQQPGQDEASEQ
jgi:hypothetical protein